MDVLGYCTLEVHFENKGLSWEVFLQGLDMTSGELVNGARKPINIYWEKNWYLIQVLLKFHPTFVNATTIMLCSLIGTSWRT
jgi:hypothetical protein